jgi:hypothetical protein
MKFPISIFSRKIKEEPENLTVQREPSVHKNRDGCFRLIQQECGWDLATYNKLIGEPILTAENLVGELHLVSDPNKRLIDSALESCLVASRLTDGKVLKAVGSNMNRIHSSKVQKSVVIISTLINHLANNLAQMEIINKSGEQWVGARTPFAEWLKNESYNVRVQDRHRGEIMTLRARLSRHLITQALEDSLLSHHKSYLNILYTVSMGGAYSPLSEIVEKATGDCSGVKALSATQKEEEPGTLLKLITEFFTTSKINEAGSKIWVNEEAAYVLFPQAGNDLRAAAKRVNMEVPADTKDLVKELIDEKIALLPKHPSTTTFPYYQKITITAQGVPKRPQVSLKIGNPSQYVDLENKEAASIEEIKTTLKKVADRQEQKIPEKENSLSEKEFIKPPSERIEAEVDSSTVKTEECREITVLKKVLENSKAGKRQDKVVVALSEFKAFVDDAMPVAQALESKGFVTSIQVNPKEPLKTIITIDSERLRGDAG